MSETNNHTGIKKFFRNCFILLISVVILDFVGGQVMHYLYFKQKSGNAAETTFVMTKCTDDVLILGSSRARRNYNPLILQDSLQMTCYNGGHDGQSIFYDEAVTQMALKRYSPKLIIIEMTPEELYYKEIHYDRLNVLAPYYNDYKVIRPIYLLKGIKNKNTTSFWYQHFGYNRESVKMWSSLYPYNSDLIDILAGQDKTKDNLKGWKPLRDTITESKKQELMNEYYKGIAADENRPMDQHKINSLENIFKLCNQKQVKVVVVIAPVLFPFNKTATYDEVVQLTNQYQVPFLDYSSDQSFNNINYFADNHMNKNGASLFSAKLGSDLKNKVINRQN